MRERTGMTIEERADYLERRRREKSYTRYVGIITALIGVILAIIGIFMFSSSVVSEPETSMQLEDMHLITSIQITELEEELIGKNNYKRYVHAKKQGSTYRFEVTEEVYEMVNRHRESNEDARYDVMYSQGMYAEKTAVGISPSE